MIGRYLQCVRALALVAFLATLVGQCASGRCAQKASPQKPPSREPPVPTPAPGQLNPTAKLASCDPPFTLSTGKTPEKLSKLIEARHLEDERQLDKSALNYKEAIDSLDEMVRHCAIEGYERVNRSMVPKKLSFCDPPLPLSTDKAPEKLSKLIDARRLEDEWQLDKSALSYKDALDSNDEPVRACALVGYARVNAKMDAIPWTYRWFNPYNWGMQYGLTPKLASILLELGAVLFLLSWFVKSNCTRRSASFAPTDDFGGSAPVKFFAAEMRAALLEIGPILNDQGGRQMTGSGSYSPPEQELQAVGNALPAIPGIDVSKLMTALLTLTRYFGYRVESGLALVDDKACAFATIRQMGKTCGHFEIEEPLPPPPVPPPLSTPIPAVTVTHLATRLAYLVSARLAWR